MDAEDKIGELRQMSNAYFTPMSLAQQQPQPVGFNTTPPVFPANSVHSNRLLVLQIFVKSNYV